MSEQLVDKEIIMAVIKGVEHITSMLISRKNDEIQPDLP